MAASIESPLPSAVAIIDSDGPDMGRPWELWWATAIVTAGARAFGVHLIVNRFGADSVRVTATIADLATGIERTSRKVVTLGDITWKDRQLSVPIARSEMSWMDGGQLRVHAELDEYAGFTLVLQKTSPALCNGGSGQFLLGSVITSQYSLGNMTVSGIVQLEGATVAVTGKGWYDRQWGNNGRFEDVGGAFNWCGVALESGESLSVWDTTMRRNGGHCWATSVHPDGAHTVFAVEPIAKSAGRSYRSALGRTVPRSWTLKGDHLGMILEVRQTQIQDGPVVYLAALEVSGHHRGRAAVGYGFCDLVGPIQ